MDKNAELNLNKYGKLVREVIDKNLTIVHVFNPKDIESVFRQEGRYPLRRSHRALLKYRRDRPNRYRSGGLFCENGEEWYRLRKLFQQHLMSPSCVGSYIETFQSITEDLINYIRAKRDSRQELQDFHYELYLWSLENTGVLALDSRLGCLNTESSEESDAKLMIRSAHDINEAVMKTERTDSWKTKDTKDYKMLVSAQDCMSKVIDKYLTIKNNELKDNGINSSENKSFLRHFLNNPDVDQKDLLVMIEDMFQAGIDTTTFTAGFALYHLSRNSWAQNKLRTEINSVLKSKSDPLSMEKFSQMPYMKACVKETMRLTPVSIGVGRVTQQEMIINDYLIPKGMLIITENQVSCRQSDYFSDPKSFIPERWLKQSAATSGCVHSKPSPFVLLPFGYGPRMCIGRRIAEMEIYVLLAKVIQNFEIQYKYSDIEVRTRLINIPNKPMRFTFLDV